MWLAIVILTIVNSVGWFLYGISCGEKPTDELMAKIGDYADYKARTVGKTNV